MIFILPSQSYRNKHNVTIYTAQSDFEYQTQNDSLYKINFILYTKSIRTLHTNSKVTLYQAL